MAGRYRLELAFRHQSFPNAEDHGVIVGLGASGKILNGIEGKGVAQITIIALASLYIYQSALLIVILIARPIIKARIVQLVTAILTASTTIPHNTTVASTLGFQINFFCLYRVMLMDRCRTNHATAILTCTAIQGAVCARVASV